MLTDAGHSVYYLIDDTSSVMVRLIVNNAYGPETANLASDLSKWSIHGSEFFRNQL